MKKIHNITLRKFASKQIIMALVLSISINWATVYYSQADPEAIQIFNGKYSMARFLLPMSFILPFLISFDILKKSVKIITSNEEKEYPFPGKRLMLKSAFINASITLISISLSLLSLYLILPGGLGIQRSDFAMFIGLFAGLLTVFFVYRSIQQIDKLIE